jgi:hypothetical protein
LELHVLRILAVGEDREFLGFGVVGFEWLP